MTLKHFSNVFVPINFTDTKGKQTAQIRFKKKTQITKASAVGQIVFANSLILTVHFPPEQNHILFLFRQHFVLF